MGTQSQGYQPEQEALKLRKRLTDLFRLGAATPETLQQAFMQVWQETERRRQTCLSEAEDHLRKYHALLAQSHAFTSIASIAYAVINGYVQLEEKRVQEMADREAERKANEEPTPVEVLPAASKPAEDPALVVSLSPNVPMTNGAHIQETPKPKTKPPGGKRKKS